MQIDDHNRASANEIDAVEAARNRARRGAEVAGFATLIAAIGLPAAAVVCLFFAGRNLSQWAYVALIAAPVLALLFGSVAVVCGRRERRANLKLEQLSDGLDIRTIEFAPFAERNVIGDHELRTSGTTTVEASRVGGRTLLILYQCGLVVGGTISVAWTVFRVVTRNWAAGYEFDILGDVQSSIAYILWFVGGVAAITCGLLSYSLQWTVTDESLTYRRTKWIFGQTERTYPRQAVTSFVVRRQRVYLQTKRDDEPELLTLGKVTPRRGLMGSKKYEALLARHNAIIEWQGRRLVRLLEGVMQLHRGTQTTGDE